MNETNYSLFDNFSLYGDSEYAALPSPAEWGRWVKFISTPVIVTLGIIGNTLSFIVMKTKSLRYKSYSHYLCALAVFDTVTLVLRLVKTVDEYYTSVLKIKGLFQDFSHASCATFNFIEHVSYLISSWLVVLMAIERLVAVWLPFKKAMIRKQSGAIITICIMCLLVCISQIFRAIMVKAIGSPVRQCAAHDSYVAIYSLLTVYYYEVALVFVLPVSIILTCNCLVLYQIFRVQKAIKQKDTTNTRYRNKQVNKRHRTTYMLLIVSFTYILTLLPLVVVQMIIDVSVRTQRREARGIYTTLYPFLELFTALSLVNYAVNFFIYILSGRSFRFELRKIFVNERSMSFTGTRTREEFIRL